MNTLFLVTMISEAVFGLTLVLRPAAILGLLGIPTDFPLITMARLFGSALLSFPVLCWFARRSKQLEFKKGAVRSLFAYYAVSTVPFLMAQMSGQMSSLGWSVIVMHLTLLIWFGYFLVK
jgi:hypothetical protein